MKSFSKKNEIKKIQNCLLYLIYANYLLGFEFEIKHIVYCFVLLVLVYLFLFLRQQQYVLQQQQKKNNQLCIYFKQYLHFNKIHITLNIQEEVVVMVVESKRSNQRMNEIRIRVYDSQQYSTRKEVSIFFFEMLNSNNKQQNKIYVRSKAYKRIIICGQQSVQMFMKNQLQQKESMN